MDHTRAIRRIHLVAAEGAIDDEDLAADIGDALAGLCADDVVAVVRHAYWCMPQVPTAALQRVAGGDGPLRAMAGRGPVTGTCRGCGCAVRARTREAVDADPPTRCARCQVSAPRTADRPAGPAGFGWEFQEVPDASPSAHRGIERRPRRWAEEYPDRESA